ncbi:MAG: chemotaxis protein CheW [Leptospirales bacterium]|nr:chemotaxis protein CheW [Leptospirales bacterium]
MSQKGIHQFLTWTAGAYSFGVPVDQCRELTRGLRITAVPLAEKHIAGIANLRGEIVTILDFNLLLGMGSPTTGRAVVRTRSGTGNTTCILADKIHEIVTVTDSDFHEVPSNLSNIKLEYLAGAFRIADKLHLIVDAQKLRGVARHGIG